MYQKSEIFHMIDHCLNENKTTIVIDMSHMPGDTFTLKDKILQDNNFSSVKQFPIQCLDFPSGIKKHPLEI